MSGSRRMAAVKWSARPMETERHAFRKLAGARLAARSECGLPLMPDSTTNSDGKRKCSICEQTVRRNAR